MVEKSHQLRFRKYLQDDDLFTSKHEILTAGSGQLDTKKVLRSEKECVENKDYSVLHTFSDRPSDSTCHSCNDADSDIKSDGEPDLVPHANSIKIWNEELQIFPQKNNKQSEENHLVHHPIDESQQSKISEYAKDDKAAIDRTKDPPRIFRGWTDIESTLPIHCKYRSSFDRRTGGLFLDTDDGPFTTIHIPDLNDFEVNFLTPTVDMDVSESPFDPGFTVGSSQGNNNCLERVTARNIYAEHGVNSPSSTASEYMMSQDYTLSFPMLMGSKSLRFCTSQAACMAERPCIERRQTIVKPNLQFKLCNAIAHKMQDPYSVTEPTNNCFLQEQHNEVSIYENKYLKNDKVSYAFTNNTLGHTSGNSLKKASHDTQAFVKKWLDQKDEIIIDCKPSEGMADGKILSLKRKRLDSNSEQITKRSRFPEGKISVSDSTILFSDYSCEHDRAYLFESF
ncbi:uncharacterized protein LOC125500984 [Athalia rosae]|uniref:uncharacterized protein LOC125500984 n=1 Tax=Athalia rosae TaxID=37344 RepID=UPI002033A303|nr:uncharacterized protein LOC125500984 [Athalia rosae]XP_048511368.1 uncharacterized protein LOC125500984 [Athalia rosae]XP_048511369.1 uncharacterized protein LOC125500984 [Athalia rosae]